jgi:hypothetical protein
MVCTHFQLYLENCTQAKDQEEVNCSLIDFSNILREIMTSWLNVILPLSFKVVDILSNKKFKGGGKSGANSKKRKQEED